MQEEYNKVENWVSRHTSLLDMTVHAACCVLDSYRVRENYIFNDDIKCAGLLFQQLPHVSTGDSSCSCCNAAKTSRKGASFEAGQSFN